MISLPSKWVKENKLDKGDEIDIESKGNKLEISIGSNDKRKEVEVNVSSLTESAARTIITNTYRYGYDKVKVNFSNKNSLALIEDTVKNNLLGFEIIKRSDKYCEIENITEPSHEQIENIFSKMFMNIDELFLIAEKMLSGEKENFEEVEKKIQQFDNFCRRVILKKGLTEKATQKMLFHSEIIHAQREIYHLLRYLSNNKAKNTNSAIYLLKKCKEVFDHVKEAYLKKDLSLIEKIHEIEKELVYKKGYSQIKENPIVIHHLMTSIREFYLSTSPLVAIIL
jgi:phosphate uptake regulator